VVLSPQHVCVYGAVHASRNSRPTDPVEAVEIDVDLPLGRADKWSATFNLALRAALKQWMRDRAC
jgi:hypothetical protein